MYQKQPQLNDGYYGPSIPPFEPSYRRSRRSNGWCKYSPMSLKQILIIICTVGIAVFLFLFLVLHLANFHLTNATLTQFNYTSNGTLHYNLSLNIIVRNPNMLFGIYYKYIEVRALFHNARFDTKFLSPFYQSIGSTQELKPVFEGQKVLQLNTDQISELKKANSTGIYKIDVKMYLKTRFKLEFFNCRTMILKPKVRCNLLVPLKGSVGVFKSTKCAQKLF